MKTADVYQAVVDTLISTTHTGEWTIAELLSELTFHVFGIDVSEQHVRRAVALLPAQCVERRNHRLFISARHFAPTEELIAAIRRADDGMNIPLMLNGTRRRELRRALVLANDWALHKSIEWARDGGAVEYGAGYGSLFVRAIRQPH